MPQSADSHSSRTCAEPPPTPGSSISGESLTHVPAATRSAAMVHRGGGPVCGHACLPQGTRPACHRHTIPVQCLGGRATRFRHVAPGMRAARRWGRSRDVTSDHQRPTAPAGISIAVAAAAAHRSPANRAAQPLQNGNAAGQRRLKGATTRVAVTLPSTPAQSK